MSAPEHTINDLKGPSADRRHLIDWIVQRIAWLGIVLILLAGLLGFLGQGPLSQRHATAEDRSLSVVYHAIERYESPTELTINVLKIPRDASVLRLRISKDFCDAATPENISPPPRTTTTLAGDDVVYEFAVADVEHAKIVYRYSHDEPGRLAYQIALDGQTPVHVRQYVLP